jgi:hypothetical protein
MNEDSTQQRVALHHDVKALAEAIVLKRGQLTMLAPALAEAKGRLLALPDDERKSAAADVVALVTRLLREGGSETAPAVAELLLVAESMLGKA